VSKHHLSLASEPWGESWIDHPYVQWAIQHSKQIGYAVLAGLFLLIVGYRLAAHRVSQAELDYVQATHWVNDLKSPQERGHALKEMQALLIRHPDLEPVYDGIIAQDLILQNQLSEARPYVDRIFSRVEEETPTVFLNYSRTTLLIAEGKIEEALQDAYALKNDLLEMFKAHPQTPYGAALYAFNTIRIAFLEKKLAHTEKERAAWDELHAMNQGKHPVAIPNQEMQRIMTHFDDEQATFTEFLKGLP
jgi:hypothetical protein